MPGDMCGVFVSTATAGFIKSLVFLQSQTKLSYNNITPYFIIR